MMMMITHIFNDDSSEVNLSKNKIIHRKEEMSDIEKFEKSNSRSGFGNVQESFLKFFVYNQNLETIKIAQNMFLSK